MLLLEDNSEAVLFLFFPYHEAMFFLADCLFSSEFIGPFSYLVVLQHIRYWCITQKSEKMDFENSPFCEFHIEVGKICSMSWTLSPRTQLCIWSYICEMLSLAYGALILNS